MSETTASIIVTKIPLLLNFREVLFGGGFIVEVNAVNGRALCVQENDGYWIYGVNPGAMAASGDDQATARREFRRAFSEILKEIAGEATSFEDFERLVREFVFDTNYGYERDWKEAVRAVRENRIELPDLRKAPADGLLRVTVDVKRVDQVLPRDNEPDLQLELAA